MALQGRTTLDLVQIASAGGGFKLEAAGRATLDLVQIAAAAARSKARVVFINMAGRSTLDLVQIATAGQGSVSFE